jgi:hypothetical protein
MFEFERTVDVNPDPDDVQLNRHEVWLGLLMKAANALPFVPAMEKCEVVERGDGWLVRDILLFGSPMTERVTFEPERLVTFERIAGPTPGTIENEIGEDADGRLTLRFGFRLRADGIPEGSQEEADHFAPSIPAYDGAVASTLAAMRRLVAERGREALEHPTDLF